MKKSNTNSQQKQQTWNNLLDFFFVSLNFVIPSHLSLSGIAITGNLGQDFNEITFCNSKYILLLHSWKQQQQQQQQNE